MGIAILQVAGKVEGAIGEMGKHAASSISKSNEEACTSNSDESQNRYSPKEERAVALMIHVVSITVPVIKELTNVTAWNNANFPKLICQSKIY
ncbi:hypothetical protein CDL15_Pgr020650 [Punica granatum]|uniref:Uncharacterized protein n=1 Tax=Punica granatum TaxID=22663 RepID=A0A218XI04_PUNGR|nr:hypothetical protein CDL15_Pgr020650 [Punica granatum]PKI32928.1 hypothetical protein CRG98_046679 [Punica granatum]